MRDAIDGSGRILVVDDEDVVQDVLRTLLTRAGYDVVSATTGEEALRLLPVERYDAVLLDLMLPDRGGMEILRTIQSGQPAVPVLMMTAFSSVENAVEAMKEGAFHYLAKPFKNQEVLNLVAQAAARSRLLKENQRLRSVLRERHRFEKIVGRSKPMQDLYRLIDQVAPTRSTVLIQGESGTGKELFAQAIHKRSTRSDGPWVVVNCSSIPSDLLEANLFGHTKGAFTGATAAMKGLFEAAGGGTLFFDEITSIRPDVQSKLLRVIQEREFLPIGSTQIVRVDVRILAATNVDPGMLVERGEFREDLYFRLKVIGLNLPPLRDRMEDLPLLAAHFTDKSAAENARPVESISPAAMERLMGWHWPGNVRELENAIERAVVLCAGTEVTPDLLPPEIASAGPRPVGMTGPMEATLPAEFSLHDAVELYEKRLIEATLRKTGGVQKKAAELLRLRATTLNEKIKRLKITP